MDERTISLTIPTFNREEMLFESFAQVYDDERISEFVISDDASDIEIFNRVKERCSQFPKIKLHRNLNNQDCYFNKMTAISHATNEDAILLDDDNIIDKSYLDRIFEIEEWDKDTAYMPSFAAPHFSYKEFEGVVVTKENVADCLNQYTMMSTMLNCMNYFVNCKSFLQTWDGSINPHTADSIYQNYRWLAAGKKIFIVPNLSYQHRIHNLSHYKTNNHKTGNLYNEIEAKLKELR